MLPNSFIEFAAARRNISLRTGCVCNPGGAAAILGLQGDMALLEPGVTLKDFENARRPRAGRCAHQPGLGQLVRRYLEGSQVCHVYCHAIGEAEADGRVDDIQERKLKMWLALT